MEKIYSYALKQAWATNGINLLTLIELISQLENKEMSIRFVEGLIGIADIERKDIPENAVINGNNCCFKSYNYLKDSVSYTYEYDDVKYFKEFEYADTYNTTGKYNWNNYSREETDEYKIKGLYRRTAESSTYLSNWIDNAKD